MTASPTRHAAATARSASPPSISELSWVADIWPLRYRRYPVFSWAWMWRRSILWGVVLLGWALFTGMSYILLSRKVDVARDAIVLTFVSLMAAHSIAPLLATLVRARWQSSPHLNRYVVAAVLVGFVLAMAIHEFAYYQKELLLKSTSLAWVTQAHREATGWVVAFNMAFKYGMFLAIFYLLGGGHALWSYFRYQRRLREFHRQQEIDALQAQKRETELRLGLLQAQVEPHFLFNTLAVVRALVRTDATRAEATLDALVDYLRATIPKLRDGERQLHSTLGHQIDLCASYLELMRLRSDGRMTHALEVDPALRELPFPPMLLITLVENAIKHGLEPKRGAGKVTITAERDGDRLRVAVIDDGVGLQPGLGGGLGLDNVRSQLDALYAQRASFDLRSAPTGGARAQIEIPLDDSLHDDSPLDEVTA